METMKRILLLILGLSIVTTSLNAQETAVTLRVEQQGGEGTYQTVQAAADKALELAASGRSVRVQLMPGTYRESVSLIGDRSKRYAPVTFESSSSEDVIISGADISNEWALNGDTFERAWTYGDTLKPHLFVQGARVAYVRKARRLNVGQCTLRKGTLYMLPPRNAVVKDGNVEVAVRAQLFEAKDLPELTIKRIAFINGAIEQEDAPPAVQFQGIQSLHLEGVRVEASGYGLFVQQARKLTLTGVDCLLNRLGGARLYWCSDITILGGSFNRNGHDAEPASTQAHGLATRKSQGLRMERTEVHENRQGLDIHYASRDTLIKNIHVYLNQGSGLALTGVDALDMVGAQFVSEADATLVELSGTRGRIRNTLFVAEGGSKPVLAADGSGALEFKDNILAAFDHQGPLFELGGIVRLENTNGNLYYNSSTVEAFTLYGKTMNLTGWQEATEQDDQSLWGDPLFTRREGFDFSLRPASPWFKK